MTAGLLAHANRRGAQAARSLIALVAALLATVALAAPATATSFVVNSIAGTQDGTCDIANCTIRDAVFAANANPGLDTIVFDLPGNAPYLIQPLTDIDPITDPVTIDGASPSGFVGAEGPAPALAEPTVILDGQNVRTNGFLLAPGSDGSTIRGLFIHGFRDGVRVDGSNNNLIAANRLGTTSSGLTSTGNRSAGAFVTNADGTTIGGVDAGAGNLISSNAFGVIVRDATNVTIVGNFIGTDLTGLVTVGNQSGIVLNGADGATIGSSEPGGRNVISGNQVHGVLMGNSNGVTIRNNYIGLGADGATSLGNAGQGIFLITNNFETTIGGPSRSDGNAIARNGRHGVRIDASSQRNTLQNNSIFANDLLALDLDGEGVTSNDTGDEDVGANTLQNFPRIATAAGGVGEVRVAGSLTTAAHAEFRIEVFASPRADPSEFGEGRFPLGSFRVTTDAVGLATFDNTLPLEASQFSNSSLGAVSAVLADARSVTATATDPLGNTSEFSAARPLDGVLGPPSSPGPAPQGPTVFASIVVRESSFDATLGHNVPNLDVTTEVTRQANFLDFYNAGGGITRWGLPTSEVFEEFPGVLAQYYQRGVVTWKESLTTSGTFTFQRVLAWDFVGGGLGGSLDQGVEPRLFSSQPGQVFGAPAWDHRVSNTSLEGVAIGFLDFFNAVGGVGSLGFPKTEARFDTHPDAELSLPGATPGFIRQYFQAAVLEFHPGDAEGQRVKLALLGDVVRDVMYPGDAWQSVAAFQAAVPLAAGQNLPRPA